MKGYKRENKNNMKSKCVRDISFEGDVVDELALIEKARINKLNKYRTKCI